MIVRDESETGPMATSFVERHNEDINRPYDTANDEDTDSKTDVDEDIDELGQNASPPPRALKAVRSEIEKSGMSEVSVVKHGGLDN